jgi:HAD superfamily hydrolase (TIGR01549 family)
VLRLTFLAAFGAVIARGADHRVVFDLVSPGLDLDAEWERRVAAGRAEPLGATDFYPDAVPCLVALHGAGYRLAIVGNQPGRTEHVLRGLPVPLAFAASSETWGVSKPDPAFFERIADELALQPSEVAYVGDRLDNDIRPAAAAGLVATFVRRGPWAFIQAGRSNPPEAVLTWSRWRSCPRSWPRLTLRQGPRPGRVSSSGRTGGSRQP